MSVKFANNAFGTLNAGISNSATSVTLSSGQGARFPTLASGEYFYATLIDTSNNLEVVKCTARSTDVLTVTRAQESTTAQAFAIGDRIELRVTAAGLTDAANPYDKDTSSTGSFALPSGTTAQQPTAADSEGHIRYDTDNNVVYYSNGTGWLKVSSVIATLSSVTGNIYNGLTSTLTLAGKGFQSSNLVVNFFQSSDSIDEDVTVTPTSDTAATVTVPAAVYNNVTSGNVVSVIVTNLDGITSAAVSKTALALPSGGTVTTSGSTRTHSFTTSGNFVNAVSNLALDVLIVGGGGAGGASLCGGGGGGGVAYATGLSKNAGTYSIVVGGGGAGPADTSTAGGNGGSSSAFGQTVTGGCGAHSRYSGTRGNSLANGAGGASGNTHAGTDGTKPTAISGFTTYGGFDGGDSPNGTTPNYPGGGGAGAGANGQSPSDTSAAGGNGGNGVQNNILGTNYYWAGGGGGSSYSGSNGAGNGGLGGGGGGSANTGTAGSGGGSALNTGGNGQSGNGNEQANQDGGAGGANTGGGGGAANHEGDNLDGDGGSGIVVIKYTLS